MQRLQTGFADFGGDLHWRHDWALSGYNTLNIGASYESMMRWVGRGTRVMAMAKVHVPYRRNANGDLTSVTIPDHVDILYELANGAQVHMRMSATTGLSSGNQLWMYGTEGSIYVDHQQNVLAGRRGDTELSAVPNPPEQQAYYRVEEQFTNAIRGTEHVTMVPLKRVCITWSGRKPCSAAPRPDKRYTCRCRSSTSHPRYSKSAARQRRCHRSYHPSHRTSQLCPKREMDSPLR